MPLAGALGRGRGSLGPTSLLQPPLPVEPTFESAAECAFIGVLKVATNRQATCKARDPDVEWLQFFLKVIGGIFSLEIGIGRQNYLAHCATAHTLQEFVDAQILRSDTLHG